MSNGLRESLRTCEWSAAGLIILGGVLFCRGGFQVNGRTSYDQKDSDMAISFIIALEKSAEAKKTSARIVGYLSVLQFWKA